MRILYFSRDYSTHDHRFLSALVKSGQQVYYLRLEQRGQSLDDRPLPPEVENVPWAGGKRLTKRSDGLRLLGDLRRVLRQVKPDIVQAGPIQTAALLVALSGFHPLITMSWGYDLLYDVHRGRSWQWATRFALRRSDGMVGDCVTIRQLATKYGMADDRIVTFPWGVDLNHFSPAPAQQPDQAFTLLSTRGWEPIYGVDVIARAFALAARERPELRLVMLGNGSQAALLRQIFTQGNVLDQVYFPGLISQADLPRYYRSADLYLSASHSDGSSISLLEAMACGKPALVSDIPGNLEWIQPGKNGWTFPDGDANALAQGILQAIVDRRRLAEMGQFARSLAEQRADWDKNFPQLFKAYDLALQHPLSRK